MPSWLAAKLAPHFKQPPKEEIRHESCSLPRLSIPFNPAARRRAIARLQSVVNYFSELCAAEPHELQRAD
jgi:hypothetical protein